MGAKYYLRMTLHAWERAAAQTAQHVREVSLLCRMLVQLGLFDRQDQSGRLCGCNNRPRRIRIDVCIHGNFVTFLYSCAREMLEERENKRALETMALPIDRSAKTIVFKKYVRHRQRDRHFANFAPVQRDFGILIQALQIVGERSGECAKLRHVVVSYQRLVRFSHSWLESVNVGPV